MNGRCRSTVKEFAVFWGKPKKAEPTMLLGRLRTGAEEIRIVSDRGPAVRVRQTPISNDEFIARYREWRSLWKPTSEQIADEVSYLSKLAELMAPVPLSKATKADL